MDAYWTILDSLAADHSLGPRQGLAAAGAGAVVAAPRVTIAVPIPGLLRTPIRFKHCALAERHQLLWNLLLSGLQHLYEIWGKGIVLIRQKGERMALLASTTRSSDAMDV